MTKSVISHAKNTFNIKTTPFSNSWKSTVLAQAKLLGIQLGTPRGIDFKVLSSTIEGRLLTGCNSVRQLKPVACTNNSSFSTNNDSTPVLVLTDQERAYLKKATFYNIKLNEDEWCELSNLHMFDAVDAWEGSLKEALFLGVNWKMSDYDPEGLERAVREKEQADNIEGREERRQANAYYYSTRGV